MHGQIVCKMHGGMAPLALAKAEERMRALVHPSVARLTELIHHADNDAVSLSAVRYVLDWAGFKPAVQAQIDQHITVHWVDEDQPIVIERVYELNGRTDG